MTIKTFMPNGQPSVSATAGNVSARLALDPNSSVVRVRQAGTVDVMIQFGDSTVVATTSDMPVATGTELFTKGAATHVAFITASLTTAAITFTNGEGI